MTEDQAKKKWCPLSRTGIYAGVSAVAVNRHISDGTKDADIEEDTRCKGSECMLWRSTPPEPFNGEHYSSGYCGLAGKLDQPIK
jgi:hypothetical protein